MPGEETSDRGDGAEDLPEVPSLPDLPKAPRLTPDLPKVLKPRIEESAAQYQKMGIAYTIPMALVVPIIGLTLGGWLLDERLHRSPAFTLAGAIIGTIVGFINLFRMAAKLNE